jgi:hypothetical protein
MLGLSRYVVLAGLLAAASSASAAEPEWGVAAGGGFAFRFSGRPGTNENVLLLTPSASWRLSSRLEYVAEGHLAYYFGPHGYMVGIVPIGGRFSIGGGPVVPYVELGAGCGWTDLDKLPEIDRRFNFILQGGAGVRGKLLGGDAWTVEARLSHYSNANTVAPNIGLNCVVLLAGWRFR